MRTRDSFLGPHLLFLPSENAPGFAAWTGYRRNYSVRIAAVNAAGGSCVDQAKAIFEGPDGRRDEGVKIDVVAQQLNGRFTEAQVREAVEHLVNEGHLYSTIDDDHFKSTNL